jgi:isopentenyl-diphosphate delta-isomerase
MVRSAPGAVLGSGDVTSDRKREHLDIVSTEAAEAERAAGWDDVHLVPVALPEVSLDEVDLATSLAGVRLAAPLVISSMTGGHGAAAVVNGRLALAAQELGIALGVGSQRAALRDPRLRPTYAVVRRNAPDALVIGNLGICQLIPQGDEPAFGPTEIDAAVEMVRAQLLAIHLNVVEELIQTEGDRATTGLFTALEKVIDACPVPVMVKETGAGLDGDTARAVVAAGAAVLDVGGAGGTSFARVEGIRAASRGDARGARLGTTFADWGIPTAASILECRGLGVPVVATGGIRTGLDAAKALALGADLVAIGRPALVAARQGAAALRRLLEGILEELRVAMVLCGARTPDLLRERPPVLTGVTLAWQEQRAARHSPPGAT